MLNFTINPTPPLGAEFYQFVNFADYIKKYLSFPLFSWKYTWFFGHPTYFDYGLIHSYLVASLSNLFSLVDASRIYILITIAVYLIFVYLIFWRLSKNKLFSVLLTLFISWASGLYHPLFAGGTIGFVVTQMFLSIVLFFVLKYYEKLNKKFLLVGSLFLGFSFLGHAGLATTLISPLILLLMLFWSDQNYKFFSFKKVKDIIFFFVPAVLLGGLGIYPALYPILFWEQDTIAGYIGLSTRVYSDALSNFFQATNVYLFIALGVSILFFLLIWRVKKIKKVIPFFILSVLFFIFVYLFTIGKNPIGNTMGPDRTYFILTLVLGCFLASLWKGIGGKFSYKIKEFIKYQKKEKIAFILRLIIFNKSGLRN